MAKTKLLLEDTDQEYDVSKEDVLIYADQIGIDVSSEKHLMWIAEKGLSASVPEPWLILSDGKDRVFYYNPKTNEKSWYHPVDKEYAALVSEERTKSKSLNSASSDYGFESKPLDSINDPTQSSGRFPKAPLQLSSLADAPPLSSSGKNSPLPPTRGKNDGGLSSKNLAFGRIENRRGTQLAPVRLNSLKMPAATSSKLSSGMSFMPKGTTLTKRRAREEPSYGNQVEEDSNYGHPPLDDSNESLNSDDGSKYSYEETDEEERNNHGFDSYDMLDASQLSPMHSADESPDAVDINSLVQLGTKAPYRLDGNLKLEQRENLSNKENSPSLSLRKVGQPSFLKPLSQVTMKKSANKGSKAKKKTTKIDHPNENETDYEDKISVINNQQKVMLDEIQKEWLAMQDDVEKQEKEKYEEMLKDSSKKLEEEEMKLRRENSEKIDKIKMELQKKIEEEESAAEKSLQTLKATNKGKITEEEDKLKKELETVSDSLKKEIKMIEEKNAAELAEKKKELEDAFKKEIENLRDAHKSNKKDLEEAHTAEMSSIQKSHEQKIEESESCHKNEDIKNEMNGSEKSELQEEIERLRKLITQETEKHEKLLKENEDIHKNINFEKDNLEKLKKETTETQTDIVDLQNEVEKIENDLDLLRSEKSGLISELSILKENIKNEKSNLVNIEKKVKSCIKETDCSKMFSEIGINTYSQIFDTVSIAIQVSVLSVDSSSQIENDISLSDAECQTPILQNVAVKSCQTDEVPSTNRTNIVETCQDKSALNSNVVDRNLENAVSGLGMKLDSRINVIEHQLRLLQENLSKPSTTEHAQEFMQNQFAEIKAVPNSQNRNIPPVYSTDSSIPHGLFSNCVPISSQKQCHCELGDSASCNVLQDVKSSVYRLNDILCQSFVPPLGGTSLPQVAFHSHSSPFDSFYTQFRDMQEKQRLTELKHKCENEAIKLTKGNSFNLTDTKALRNSSQNESLKPSYHLMHSSHYSYNVPDDPLIRARNIVLREQAKAWKEQQQLNSSFPHIFSLNSSSELSQSSITGFATTQNVPLSQQTFLNFEVDPETDYNMWMTRLNALQLRIRSHKMI